jgi:hypothetical protein
MASIFDTTNLQSQNKVGTFESMLAGVGSGLIAIPKGLFSLGATLMDLGVNSGKAAAVEQWFDDLTTLDEKAEATAAGKITELLVNIGVPGGYGFKLGSQLAKKSMLAKKSGSYLEPLNKSLQKGVEQATKLNARGKTNQFFAGAIAGGVAEGVFVGDVEKIGSFGDLIGGPTRINRGEGEDAVRDLLNRVKFGTEGALFTGIVGGVGSTIKKLTGRNGKLDIANSKMDRLIDKVAGKFRARSDWTPEGWKIMRASKGASGADTVLAKNISRDTDKFIDGIFPVLRTIWNKTPDAAGKTVSQNRDIVLKEINDLLLSGDPRLVSEVKTVLNAEGRLALQAANKTKGGRPLMEDEFIKQLSPNDAQKFTQKRKGFVTKWDDMPEENFNERGFDGEIIKGKDGKPLQYKGWRELSEKLVDLGASNDDIMKLKVGLAQIRQRWGDLFTAIGRTLDPDEMAKFKEIFGDKFKSYLGSTYDIMQNKSIIPWLKYRPTSEAVDEVRSIFQDTFNNLKTNKDLGRTLSDLEAEQAIERILNSAELPKGMRMDKPSEAYFRIPEFMAHDPKYFATNSVYDNVIEGTSQTGRQFANIAQLNKQLRPALENLLGKQRNPMQTILGGMAKLSMVAQRNIFFRNLFNKNEELLTLSKTDNDIMPMFTPNENQAQSLFGSDYRAIQLIDEAQRGRVGMEAGASNPFGEKGVTYYARPGIAEAIENLGINNKGFALMGSETLGDVYTGLLLYPKATSQIAKTILSPITHMRNFISAGAFAAANGIMPANFSKVNVTIAGKEVIENPMKLAYQALQTGLKGTRQQNDLYEKLIRLGVVNSNVRLGDLSRLLQDINFGETMSYQKGLRGMMKQLSKVKSIGQDLYTAEDDFWKIYSWAIEKSRLTRALEKQGVTRGTKDAWIKDSKGQWIEVTEDWLENEAADIVKNNIPNYDYVPDFIKSLRKLPIGNFVSFPAEIARTGANIVQRALREIKQTYTLANGRTITPFEGIGYTRLFGFTTTVAAIPYAAQKMFQTIYDVTDDERAAIRRYVAGWSKNSTILPMKDEDGNFKYIDFSHANAYDTLIRPLQTVINAVADGQSEDGIMNDFMRGMFTSMSEFGEPFISESIWTEAVSDIVMRGGRTRDGFQVYNTKDSAGNKATKIMRHLVKAQMPFSVDQFARLDRAFKPVNFVVDGKYDKYGQEYEFGDEFAGLFGFRAVALNTDRTIKFKVAEYKQGVRDSGALFTRETLKGGPIEPREIVDAYINANRALFNVKKNFKQDLDAAVTLGISDEAYDNNVDISVSERSAIENDVFRPYRPSLNIQKAFADNAEAIGESNPYDIAADAINSISEELSGVSLSDPEFPLIENPLVPMNLGTTLPNIGSETLPTGGLVPQTVTNQGGNLNYYQMTDQQKLAHIEKYFPRG